MGPRCWVSYQLLGCQWLQDPPSKGRAPACREREAGEEREQPRAWCFCSSCPRRGGNPGGVRVSSRARVSGSVGVGGNQGTQPKKRPDRRHSEGCKAGVAGRKVCGSERRSWSTPRALEGLAPGVPDGFRGRGRGLGGGGWRGRRGSEDSPPSTLLGVWAPS